MQQLIDLGTDSPRAMSPEKMSNECAVLLVHELDQDNFALTCWQYEFIVDMTNKQQFSLDQKKVIYDLAHKFKIL